MAWRTYLIRIILLAMLSKQKVHEESLVSKLSRRVLQEACFMAESNRGAPRYFEGSLAIEKSKILAIFL